MASLLLLMILALCVAQIVYYRSHDEEFFWSLLFSSVILYIPGMVYYYATTHDTHYLILFSTLFLLSVVSFTFGYFRFKAGTQPNFDLNAEPAPARFIIIGLLLDAANNLLIKDFLGNSQLFLGLFFLIDDLGTIFFWGGAGLLFFHRNNDLKAGRIGKNFLLLIGCILLHLIPPLYLLYRGTEYSRFSIIFPLFFIIFLYFRELRHKTALMLGLLLSLFCIVVFFNPFYGGDLLIVKNAIDVISSVDNNLLRHEYLMIPYNTGFHLFPNVFDIKPLLYNPSAQYMLQVIGWSFAEVKNFPFGIGITGVADAYWNLGYAGIVLYFFLAGSYLRFMKNIAVKHSSPFLYGIYVLQVINIILLYRLDFSFYFRHLIVILPFLYFLTKNYTIAFKDSILIKLNITK